MIGERDIWTDPARDDGHDHAACVVAALDRAEEICSKKGARLTEIRRRVLKLVWRSHGPIGAYDILESLRLDNRRAAAPTVYRALDFLLAQGLIHRIESFNAYVGCPRPGTPHHGPFLICRDCGRSFELLDGQLDAVVDIDAARAGFMVERRTLELHGLCPRCRGEKDAELAAGGAGSKEGAPESGSGEVTASGKDALPGAGADGGIQETPSAALGLPLVEASGIHAHIGGQHILQGVNLAVHDGEIVTLIGPNGAGKTTLVRAVLGLLSVSRGRVFRRRGLRVGYMPQRMEVDHGMPLTVSRFLTLGGVASPHAIGPVLSEVGAGRLIDAPVQSISGGEWRRVLLARALLRNPDLLVLDEPVQGVDVTGQSELYRLISDVRDRHGCGVLMVSHDLHVVMEATDRVVCLNHHVCCTGHPEVVSRHPEYLSLFGAQAWRGVAVYTHHHDHEHDMHGDVLPFWSGGGRSSGRAAGPVDGAGEGGGAHG